MWIVGGAGNYFCVSNPNRKKTLFILPTLLFSHTTIVWAFGSVVVADLGFTICFVESVSNSSPGH